MSIIRTGLVLCMAMCASAVWAHGQQQEAKAAIDPQAWRLVLLANAARNAQGTKPLWWDPALAKAALEHCQRMAQEGEIAHRYGGEANVGERAGQAGAHFSLIEENIAIGATPAAIHEEWMNSPEHRTNLLNPEVDRIGTAVVTSRGVLYAVADYARAVPVLGQAQAESRIADLIRVSGIGMVADPATARAACAMDRGWPTGSPGQQEPLFVMRWQDADLSHLPAPLVEKLKTGAFRQASVGSCPAKNMEGAFTLYRFAVLLYGPPIKNGFTPQF